MMKLKKMIFIQPCYNAVHCSLWTSASYAIHFTFTTYNVANNKDVDFAMFCHFIQRAHLHSRSQSFKNNTISLL